MGETTEWFYDLSTSWCDPSCTGKDSLSIPLSYVANTDGTFTIVCNANFRCDNGEAYTLQSMTCTAPGNTVTAATHTGSGNLGASWTVGPLTAKTTFTVAISLSHFGTKSASNTITLPASGSVPTYTTYYTSTITHTLTATATDANSKQWQESADGSTWTNINGATGDTLTIGTWAGAEATTEESANTAAYAAIPAYDKYYRCQATNAVGTTASNVLHVVHAGGAGNPTVTNVSP